MSDQQYGKLYCVATPIGNMDDFTPRAKDILQKVDLIAAEDTRVLQDLCREARLSLKAKFLSYFDAREAEKAPKILSFLLEGKSVAIVADAGTPNIYDPGFRLLKLAFENNIDVIPIPGVSSIATALSICPLPGLNFCFFGFAPNTSSARQKFFRELQFDGRVIFFETPHRLLSHLEDAAAVWGKAKTLFLCRELTKKYEEKGLKSLGEWILHFEKHSPKGEFVLIYEGSTIEVQTEDLDHWLKQKMKEGISGRDLLQEAQSVFKMNRKELYKKILSVKGKPDK